MYKCTKCGRAIELDPEFGAIRCPYCGCRLLFKERPPVVKKVKAI
ncbi:MAG: DNA-directed RNA polymerase subunit P [Euryarchaeota archaeon]|nr:DNA-directed RNA polymerase subunit P [Euryarchaeota archaeon]